MYRIFFYNCSILNLLIFFVISSLRKKKLANVSESLFDLCGAGLVTKSCATLAIPWTITCQAPLSMRSSRQEYGSGLPFPSPGDPPDAGIEPKSPALQADYLPSEPPEKPNNENNPIKIRYPYYQSSCCVTGTVPCV